MKICTFFGHRDASDDIRPVLKGVIVELIEKEGVRHFLVGSQGRFDWMAAEILKELSAEYGIGYEVVLAYMPWRKEALPGHRTLLPEGQEQVPCRFAIDRRNFWMVEQSDYVISYIYKVAGGAVKFTALAERKGKKVIKI